MYYNVTFYSLFHLISKSYGITVERHPDSPTDLQKAIDEHVAQKKINLRQDDLSLIAGYARYDIL